MSVAEKCFPQCLCYICDSWEFYDIGESELDKCRFVWADYGVYQVYDGDLHYYGYITRAEIEEMGLEGNIFYE